jgi:hypothetical protein
VCGQSFTRAHDRKRHAQTHTQQPAHFPGDPELAPSSYSCEPEGGLGLRSGAIAVVNSTCHQLGPHASGTDIAPTHAGSEEEEEENIDVDPESQLHKNSKPSSIRTHLKKYGSLLVLLVILIIHIVLALLSGRGGSNDGHSLSLSLGPCNDGPGVNVNASYIGDVLMNCFRMNQTFGS